MAKQDKLTDQQTALFCRGLALQLHAGISLADGVHLLAEDETGGTAAIYRKIGAALDQGVQLADALEESGSFPEYVRGMVKIGQQTGKLEQTLQSLYGFYDRSSKNKRLIKNAVTYPVMVFVLMLVVVAVLLVKVLPVFDGVYESLGSSLTGVAAGLLRMGQLLDAAMPAILALLALGVGFVMACMYLQPVRSRCLRWYRNCLGDREINRKFNNARFAQALALGLSSGLMLEEAIALAKNLLQHIPGAARRCDLCAAALEQGAPLPEALAEAELLPRSEGRMLAAGLRSGNGDRVMEEIAERISDQAEASLEDAVSAIEPAMVLVAALLIGLILLSVMVPLVNIMGAIG